MWLPTQCPAALIACSSAAFLGASSRCYIMEKGLMRHHAPSADLKADPSVIHQYMGV